MMMQVTGTAGKTGQGVRPIMPGAEPFLYEAGRTGCVLVHGFTSSPSEMRGLGRYLADRGITASADLLPGHGTSPGDLRGKTWHDWRDAVYSQVEAMGARCDRVYLAGLSLGGALSLYTAAERGDRIAGVIAMSSPIFLPRGLSFVLNRMQKRVPYMNKHYRDIQDPVARAAHVSYMSAPVDAMASLVEFMRPVRSSLPRVKVPALVVRARRDHVVPPASSRYILRRLGSADKSLITLDRGFHIVTIDRARNEVYTAIYSFIRDREA
ncbi:MAG TPA: alpha/beta fold hydrolase [Chloroflexia bacterium]|nr:alpha/beta fold hydrolase [Chloroflexia bacterium]